MKLLLIRHGETETNRQLVLAGWSDAKLSDRGREQARDAAKRMKDIHIDIAYSSDLSRASDTAKEIMNFHKGIKLHIVKNLRERDVGELEGAKAANIEELFALGLGPNKNGETLERFQQRIVSFTNKVYSGHSNETVLFVGHGGTIKAILNAFESRPASKIPEVKTIGNTEIIELQISDPLLENIE